MRQERSCRNASRDFHYADLRLGSRIDPHVHTIILGGPETLCSKSHFIGVVVLIGSSFQGPIGADCRMQIQAVSLAYFQIGSFGRNPDREGPFGHWRC